jgi:hypothetical protein
MPDRRLLEGIPRIRRARGYRLYDIDGRRYLDLYRDGALLGHREAGVITIMKSILSQGLSTSLPTAWEGRLRSLIRTMLSDWTAACLCGSPESALMAAGRVLGTALSWNDVWDPALSAAPDSPPRVALWRPLLPVMPGTGVLLLQLPVTICGAPMPVCFVESGAGIAPDSDLLPGFILAAAVRGLAALARSELREVPRKGGIPSAASPVPDNDILACAIDRTRAWKRRGPYVRAVFAEGDYPRVHKEFLRAGVLLFPGYPGPSVLPGECSPGESRLLADLFAGIPGG